MSRSRDEVEMHREAGKISFSIVINGLTDRDLAQWFVFNLLFVTFYSRCAINKVLCLVLLSVDHRCWSSA